MVAADAARPGTPERGPVPELLADLRRRLSRLSLAGLAPSVAVLVVLTWATSAVMLVLVSIPGLLEQQFTWELDPPAPPWFRGLLLIGCAVVAAGGVATSVLGDARRHPGPARVLLRDAAALSTGLGVGALLLASDFVVPAAVAAAGGIAAVVLLRLPLPRGTSVALAAGAGAVPWLAALAAQFVTPDPGLLGWLWIVLLPLAGGLAAFGALYGVARGAQSRTDRLSPVFRDDLPIPALVLVVAGTLGVVALRYTVLSGLFGDLDAQLWRLAPSLSWLHAGLVAVAVTVVVLRVARRPLTRVGRGLSTAVFGAAAAIQLALLGPLILTVAVTAILWGTGVDGSDLVVALAPWLSVALVVALAIAVAHPVFAGSAGRWMTWVGAFYVLPGALAAAVGSAMGPAFDSVPSFWAKPPQVVALLAVASAVLLVAGLVRPAAAVPRRLVLRLALVPLIAVHATALLPAPWETLLGRAVLVAGVVLGILLLAPRRTADPRSRGRRLLGRSTLQLAALVVFVLALPSVLSGTTFGIVGTLWLAVPVAVGLCLTLVPRTESPPEGTPAVLVDASAEGD